MKLKNIYHRDGTVTYWDVYRQIWRRDSAATVAGNSAVMATFNDSERRRTEKHARRRKN